MVLHKERIDRHLRGRLVEGRWAHDPAVYAPPRYRRGCSYKAFVPDTLAELPAIEPAVAGAISAAEEAIRELKIGRAHV